MKQKNEKNIKKINKENRGITLIALIVTIIVLLILAGISIAMLVGENGLIGKANWAKFVTEYATVKEGKDLYEIDNEMKKQIGKNKSAKVATTEGRGINISLENKELMLKEVLKLADTETSSTTGVRENVTTNITNIKEKYPIIENGKVENSGIVETLKETIKTTENIEEITEEKVELYKVDMNLINLDIKNEYVINIKTGELYKLVGVKYQGKTYHRPDWGVTKKRRSRRRPRRYK